MSTTRMLTSVAAVLTLTSVGCMSQSNPGIATTSSAPLCTTGAVPDAPVLSPDVVVSAAKWQRREGKQMLYRLRGAKVRLAAQPGLTEQWLQEQVDCQMASYASGETNGADPLAVPGVKARVIGVRAGFVVELEAADAQAAREVLQRALALNG